jgi:phospholipase C
VSDQDKAADESGRQPGGSAPTRREFMIGGGAAIGGMAIGAAGAASAVQENRSFDHYFGTLSGVRRFSDPAVPTQTVSGKSYPIFDQFGYQPGTGADASGYLQPFRLLSDPPVPNLSAWRRGVTGDMTGALALSQAPNTTVPALPATSLGDTSVAEQAVLNALAGTLDVGIPYPLPKSNSMPAQESTPARPPMPS